MKTTQIKQRLLDLNNNSAAVKETILVRIILETGSALSVRAMGLGRGGGLQSPWLGQSHYFSGKSYFFRAEASSHKWKNIFLYLLNDKKTEFIPSSEITCPQSGIFTNNYWVRWVGQSNFAG